ncbi:DUF2283 domain-containing protein [Vibrio spartinae]|uniref:DUF2283 domain-containing protein n=1 Tax=Vibrio spartinae TaxID=1918945 RepID=A0ABX6R313_9VIBR|nr:DUF2283 domain-containing protein [Vibrio spartinae]QMV15552.1 hypothetical protein Vspart_02873 [Vibrio spartinae]QMV15556.1 hypothetical protein Vspart_02878 [Vibrio spartinae]
MSRAPIQLKVSADDDEVAYLYLPEHPKKVVPGIVKKQVRLSEIVKNYNGPDIYLDFNENNELIGIEIT